jgi:hypothetical protein
LRTLAVTQTERRAIAERGNPVAFVYFLNFLVAFSLRSDGVSPLAMARRSVRVAASVRKSQETRSQTRYLSTFPYVQNAPSVAQARLRGVRARRHNCGAPAPVKIKIKIKLNVTEMKNVQVR